jgi:hypothetical protein
VDKEILIWCVSNNNNTTDGATSYHLVTDTHGHTWEKVFELTETDGAVADGCTVSLWRTKVTTEIGTGNSITNTYQGANNAAGIIHIVEAVVGAGNTLAWETPATTIDTSMSAEAISATLSGLTNREYLFFGALGAESNDNSKTPIANYTERFDSRSGSSSTADVAGHVGTRILTGTGDTWTTSAMTGTSVIQSLTAFYEVSLNSDRRYQVSFAELEVPTAPRRYRVSFAELEIPNAPRRYQMSFAELEIPNADRRYRVSFAELEIPTAPRRYQLSWVELELPDGARRYLLAWAEMEVPDVGGGEPPVEYQFQRGGYPGAQAPY